jgi:hypothetical protein
MTWFLTKHQFVRLSNRPSSSSLKSTRLQAFFMDPDRLKPNAHRLFVAFYCKQDRVIQNRNRSCYRRGTPTRLPNLAVLACKRTARWSPAFRRTALKSHTPIAQRWSPAIRRTARRRNPTPTKKTHEPKPIRYFIYVKLVAAN